MWSHEIILILIIIAIIVIAALYFRTATYTGSGDIPKYLYVATTTPTSIITPTYTTISTVTTISTATTDSMKTPTYVVAFADPEAAVLSSINAPNTAVIANHLLELRPDAFKQIPQHLYVHRISATGFRPTGNLFIDTIPAYVMDTEMVSPTSLLSQKMINYDALTVIIERCAY